MNAKMVFLNGCVTMLAIGLGAGCWERPIAGGPCTYKDTVGTATIVSVNEPGPDSYSCYNDPVEVIFDFVPDDPEAAELGATGVRLTISAGENPPSSWVDAEGLTEGSQHPCIRHEIATGTCVPLFYEFSEVDYQAAVDACW